MKSMESYIKQTGDGKEAAMDEVEESAKYAGLDHKEILQLRLLCEELIGMMKEIAGPYDAKFWLEADGNRFELHLEAKIKMNQGSKEELYAMATDKKPLEGQGIMGKIRGALVRCMNDSGHSSSWSLNQYRNHVEEVKEEQERDWDELEKSIVANLADDVLITANNRRAEVIIIKSFQRVYGIMPK